MSENENKKIIEEWLKTVRVQSIEVLRDHHIRKIVSRRKVTENLYEEVSLEKHAPIVLPPGFLSWEFSAENLGLTQEDLDLFRAWRDRPGWEWKPVPAVMTDKGPELRKEARVQCGALACNKRERWVDWDRRGDTACSACSGKMQYTGEMRLV